MTADAKHLIHDFEALPDSTKREVLAKLVRISRHLEYPEVSDDELLAAADEVFLSYEAEEQSE